MIHSESTRVRRRRGPSRNSLTTVQARPRRGRPEREAQLLEAAFTEFAANGYAGTRLDDVARRAGVAKGLPHFYFETKEELFRAVLRSVIVPIWSELLDRAGSGEGPTAELLRATLEIMYERLAGNVRARQLMRLLIAEGPRFPELTDLYYSEVVARGIDLWKRLIARGVERGEFRAGRFSDNPQVIYGPALMAAIWQLLFGAQHRLDLDSWFESHLDLILKGLERRDAG